jgi:hypothetical protein
LLYKSSPIVEHRIEAFSKGNWWMFLPTAQPAVLPRVS